MYFSWGTFVMDLFLLCIDEQREKTKKLANFFFFDSHIYNDIQINPFLY